MASLKDIRNRIDSVRRTQKTTSAMKMVSAAKLKRSEDNIKAAIPYAQKLKDIVSPLSYRFTDGQIGANAFRLFQTKEVKNTGVILVTTDRGLCGGFNSNLCKALLRKLNEESIDKAELSIIGRKGNDFFKRTTHNIINNHSGTQPENQLSLVKEIVNSYTKKFEKNEIDQVYLAYNHFISVISQKPVIEKLLPINPAESSENMDDREIVFLKTHRRCRFWGSPLALE